MPVTTFNVPEKYRYQNGFGSYHEYVSSHLSSESSHVMLTVTLGLKLLKELFL